MKRMFYLLLLFSLFLPFCNKSSPTSPSTPTKNPPIINSFTINPSEINYGQTTTLSWNVSNATKIIIDQGIGEVSSNSSREIKPLSTTTYTLTASNNDGQVTKTCLVTIKAVTNVVMIEGPIFEDGYSIFEYKGIIKNIGNLEAKWVKIYVYIRKPNNDLITFEYTYADDYTLSPGETSPWNVIFWDDNKSIRNTMDKSKTTYEIKWD